MRRELLMTDGAVARARPAYLGHVGRSVFPGAVALSLVFSRRCGICRSPFEFPWTINCREAPAAVHRCPECVASGLVRPRIPTSANGRARARKVDKAAAIRGTIEAHEAKGP